MSKKILEKSIEMKSRSINEIWKMDKDDHLIKTRTVSFEGDCENVSLTMKFVGAEVAVSRLMKALRVETLKENCAIRLIPNAQTRLTEHLEGGE